MPRQQRKPLPAKSKPSDKAVQPAKENNEEDKQNTASKCPCGIVFSVIFLLLSILIGCIFFFGMTQSVHSVLTSPEGSARLSPNFLGIEGDFYLSNVTGLYIHHREWKPNKDAKVYSDPEYNIDDEQMRYPRAVVVISPGRYLHANWFDNFATRLAEDGAVAVLAFDQPGFGKSEGDRGYAKSMKTLIDEAEAVVRMARAKYPGVPTVCLGEDIGAYTMAQLASKRTLYGKSEPVNEKVHGKNILCNGLAMFAPPSFGVVEKLYFNSEIARKVISFIAEKVPKLPVPVYYSNSVLTADPKVAARFSRDEFASKMFRVRTLKLMLDAKRELLEHPERITSTVELIQGMNDTLTDTVYNHALVAGASNMLKSTGITERSKHFLVTDEGTSDRTLAEFNDWLRLAIYNMVEDFPNEDDD